MEYWILKNWMPLISGGLQHYFCEKGYFVFLFKNKDDSNLIFRSGPYFMGLRGLYLNCWNLSFDLEKDVSSVMSVWVHLPHLPLHCWSSESLETIGNKLSKYIDRADRKDQYACARICVEVDLEMDLTKEIKLTIGEWSHI